MGSLTDVDECSTEQLAGGVEGREVVVGGLRHERGDQGAPGVRRGNDEGGRDARGSAVHRERVVEHLPRLAHVPRPHPPRRVPAAAATRHPASPSTSLLPRSPPPPRMIAPSHEFHETKGTPGNTTFAPKHAFA
jgi:hypothetical protein